MDLAVAQKLACNLMAEHGLTNRGPQDSWTFRFDGSRRRFGLCSYGPRRIQLSKHLVAVNGEAAVRNTVLHEIAHALVPVGSHHGPVWVAKAKAIGCDGARCYNSSESFMQYETPKARVIGTCPNGHTTNRTNLPRRKLPACTMCCRAHNNGKFDPRFLFTWKRNAA